MTTRCLVHVMSPIHAVTSICAIRALHPDDDVAVTLVVQWPGSQFSDELAEIVRTMVRPFAFVRDVVTFPYDRLTAMLALGRRPAVEAELRRALGVDAADEIYYPHDIVGQLYQTLAMVWPAARRVCFGDGMGFVYERKVRLSYVRTPPVGARQRLLDASAKLAGRLVERARSVTGARRDQLTPPDAPPHAAALVLPVDQSGNFLAHVPLTVCPRPSVLATLAACAEACAPLSRYLATLLADYGARQKLLFLTENFAESGTVDLDEEVAMYCSVIVERCPPGSVVFLKPHPGESLPRGERIAERLRSRDLEVVQLDPRFRRYPIELWRELVLASTVICMASPVLSLRYLYGIDVVQPMDDAFIERWLPEWTWAAHKNAILLYMEPLRRLAAWDGRSVLYAGTLGRQP